MSPPQWSFLHLKHALTTLSLCVSHRGTGTDTTPRQRTHIDFDLLAVRVLNCRIVALDPDILDELCCSDGQNEADQGVVNLTSEARLAHAA
jgi:hypothetical protein